MICAGRRPGPEEREVIETIAFTDSGNKEVGRFALEQTGKETA